MFAAVIGLLESAMMALLAPMTRVPAPVGDQAPPDDGAMLLEPVCPKLNPPEVHCDRRR